MLVVIVLHDYIFSYFLCSFNIVAIPLWLIYLTWKYGIYAMVVVIVRQY